MSSPLEIAALQVRPPILSSIADTTGVTGLFFRDSLAVSPASNERVFNAKVRGMWLTLFAIGEAVDYGVVLKGQTAPTLIFGQTSAAGTGDEQAGARILANERVQFQIPADAYSLVYIAGANTAGALLEAYVSSRRAASGSSKHL